MSNKEKIAVIGSGLMGHGIAQIFAVHGHSVTLMDLHEDLLLKAIDSVRSNLTLMAQTLRPKAQYNILLLSFQTTASAQRLVTI